jgi:hypothetical protein
MNTFDVTFQSTVIAKPHFTNLTLERLHLFVNSLRVNFQRLFASKLQGTLGTFNFGA